MILASFYYGYVVIQIPGGWLAQRFGGTVEKPTLLRFQESLMWLWGIIIVHYMLLHYSSLFIVIAAQKQ